MKISAQQLCEQFPKLVISSRNTDNKFSSIDASDRYHQQSLIFVSDESKPFDQRDHKPAVLVTTEAIADSIEDQSACVIAVANVKLAQAIIKRHYCDYDATDSEWDAIHPTAVIHASASLGENVRIGANSVVGKNVVIGDNTGIRANCVIEHDVLIGQECSINNLVNIGYGCTIGNRVVIQSGAIIGAEGFGFAEDHERVHHRIPHTGIVEIQDDVQVGSNSNIDRATYGKTLISRGVKIDSLCHIGHNVSIDEDCLIIAQTGISGSSHIGKRVVVTGQTGVLDHRSVADDAILLHRCGVTEDIPSGGLWAGTPAKPFREYVRDLNSAKKLDKLTRRLEELSRQLADKS